MSAPASYISCDYVVIHKPHVSDAENNSQLSDKQKPKNPNCLLNSFVWKKVDSILEIIFFHLFISVKCNVHFFAGFVNQKPAFLIVSCRFYTLTG